MRAAVAGLALLVIAPVHGAAQSLPGLDTLVPSLMRRYDVPGVALAVVRGDSVIALRGFGMARVRDSARVDPRRTMFRLASVSKLFVATAVMQQVERGALDLNADVNRYLAWHIPDTWPAPVTLDRLLTHTAGFDERLIGYAATSRDSIGDLGSHLAANLPSRGWPPGAVIAYSNYGFALAAHVVERATKMPFAEYARTQIFEPLGMRRTYYIHVPDSLRGDLAEGNFCDAKRCRPAPEVFSHPYPVGLSYSTAEDMARFLVAQLGGGPSIRLLQAQHFTADPALPGMSYAFFNQRHRGHTVLTHGGNVPGVNNLLLLVPDERIGIYFVANGGRTAFGAALRDALLEQLLAPRDTPPAPRVSLGDAYVRSLVGPYQSTRYAHRTVEAFPLVFATTMEIRADSGRIVLFFPNAAATFEPVDSLHFREMGGERMIGFGRDATGRVTHLFAPVPFFGAELPGVLERRHWYEAPHFLNEYVSWLLLGPLLLLVIAWPLVALGAWWLRRRRGAVPVTGSSLSAVAVGCALAFNALWVVFGFGFIARSTRMFEGATGLVFGVTPQMRALAVLPWIMTALAGVVTVSAVIAITRKWWDPLRRTMFAAVACGAVMTVVFLVQWNYLPAVF